jgi:Na+:H+ antiporter, NhaA family
VNERPGPPDEPEFEEPLRRSDARVPRRLLRPLQEFLETSTSSGVVLLGAVVVALVWVNSPWSGSYSSLLATRIAVGAGEHAVVGDVHFWINEGLMAFFFLVVGLEIKRELTIGELRRPRAAFLPVITAVTGMAVPALLFVAIVGGGAGARGWGIPMATDVAFALGVLALAAARMPSGLRPLLLAIAIVDDIGSVIVVAAFSPRAIAVGWLVLCICVAGVAFVLPRLVRVTAVHVILGIALWYAMYRAGLHPALAGIVVALLAPSGAPSEPQIREEDSPLTRAEHILLPWTSFVVLPLFALANVGVELSASSIAAAAASSVAWAILVARVGGKLIGIWGGAMLASRLGLADLPDGVRPAHLAGIAVAAGTGFTVSLFVAEVAFGRDSPLLAHVKISLLAASLVSASVGYGLLRRAGASSREAPANPASKGT